MAGNINNVGYEKIMGVKKMASHLIIYWLPALLFSVFFFQWHDCNFRTKWKIFENPLPKFFLFPLKKLTSAFLVERGAKGGGGWRRLRPYPYAIYIIIREKPMEKLGIYYQSILEPPVIRWMWSTTFSILVHLSMYPTLAYRVWNQKWAKTLEDKRKQEFWSDHKWINKK